MHCNGARELWAAVKGCSEVSFAGIVTGSLYMCNMISVKISPPSYFMRINPDESVICTYAHKSR